ncbi:MAG: hypothetical protein H0V05_10455 [Euzebyaceae bacterium]|nr:hypothetical protein [Euzebyaceae bacterium]
MRADNDRLRERNEALARAARRQAAPFSRRPGGSGEAEPKRAHKRAGRKPGAAYGAKAHRPQPDHVDRVVKVGLPDACPCCGGGDVEEVGVAEQFHTDLPPVARTTRHDITIRAVPRL